jgi:selenide,water dikinase
MAQLNRAAAETAVEFGARAATDITGFGFLGHAHQLADASSVTLALKPSRAWFLPRTLELAADHVCPGGMGTNRAFYAAGVERADVEDVMLDALYDPQTSGGLLIAVPPRRASAMLAALKRRRVWGMAVGEARARSRFAIELQRSS